VARTTFRPGPAAGFGDEADEGLGLAFAGLRFELGAGLANCIGAVLPVAGVVTVRLAVPAELALVVRLDVLFADRAAGVEAGGHSCCEQGIMALLLTPRLAVSRMTATASAVTRTVGKITAQK
jgi:hypothetical protein